MVPLLALLPLLESNSNGVAMALARSLGTAAIALFLVIEMLTLDFTFLMLSFGSAIGLVTDFLGRAYSFDAYERWLAR